MTNGELLYKVKCAENAATPQQAMSEVQQAVYNYTLNKCYYPKELDVTFSDLDEHHRISVRCGKCDNCRDLYRSEWVTRMYLECKAHLYQYMVTLHYAPVEHYDNIPKELLDAYWHYDNLNSTNHLAWHPCLCRIEHVQMFFRHLRYLYKDTNANIRYFFCMEYGHDFGRPHAHILLWSDVPLTRDSICKAWSIIRGRKNPVYIPIGTFDFEDLYANGTIVGNNSVMLDGKRRSAKFAFNYLCKYICKDDSANYSRVKMLIEDLKDPVKGYKNNLSKSLIYVLKNSKHFVRKLLGSSTGDSHIDYTEIKRIFCTTLPMDVRAFCQLFACFTSCSRAEGIGSRYLQTNMSKYIDGLREIEQAPFGKLVFPRFFLRKIKEQMLPLYGRSVGSLSHSYSAKNRSQLLHNLSLISENAGSLLFYSPYVQSVSLDSLAPSEIDFLCRSAYSLKNPVIHTRCLIGLEQTQGYSVEPDTYPYLYQYHYNRKLKHYEFVSKELFSDWFSVTLDQYEKLRDKTRQLVHDIEHSQQQLVYAITLIDEICASCDYDVNYVKMRYKCVDKFEDERKHYLAEKHKNYSPKIF